MPARGRRRRGRRRRPPRAAGAVGGRRRPPRGSRPRAGDVRQRLGDHEVGGGLDRGREPLGERDVDRDRDLARSARPESAASSPRSLSTEGWIPRTRSRSSRIARLASSCAPPAGVGGRRVVGAASRAPGPAPSRCRRAGAGPRRAGRARSGAAGRRRIRRRRSGSSRASRSARSSARAPRRRAARAPSRRSRPPARGYGEADGGDQHAGDGDRGRFPAAQVAERRAVGSAAETTGASSAASAADHSVHTIRPLTIPTGPSSSR